MNQPWLTTSDCPVKALDGNDANSNATFATSSTVVNSPSTVSLSMRANRRPRRGEFGHPLADVLHQESADVHAEPARKQFSQAPGSTGIQRPERRTQRACFACWQLRVLDQISHAEHAATDRGADRWQQTLERREIRRSEARHAEPCDFRAQLAHFSHELAQRRQDVAISGRLRPAQERGRGHRRGRGMRARSLW
jgi:hypothetical protein